jgi:hypothetical protein
MLPRSRDANAIRDRKSTSTKTSHQVYNRYDPPELPSDQTVETEQDGMSNA